MFDYHKERRKLLRQIAAVDKQFVPRLANEGEDTLKDYKSKRNASWLELQVLITGKLQRDMQRFGIVETFGPGWKLDARGEQFYLSVEALARGKKLVSEARITWWQKWIALLTPPIAILISIIALIVSFIALRKS